MAKAQRVLAEAAANKIFAADFNNGDGYWVAGYAYTKAALATAPSVTQDYPDVTVQTVAGIGKVLRASGGYRVISERATRPFIAGQRFRATIRTRIAVDPAPEAGAHTRYYWLAGINADGSVGGYSSSVAVKAGKAAADGWFDDVFEFTPSTISSGVSGWGANTVEWRLMIGLNGYDTNVGGAVQEVLTTRIDDIASEKAASDYAEQSKDARDVASTKAGEASSSASTALDSMNTATGAASTAIEQAGIAASAKLAAILVEGNPGFEQGYEGWSSSVFNAAPPLMPLKARLVRFRAAPLFFKRPQAPAVMLPKCARGVSRLVANTGCAALGM